MRPRILWIEDDMPQMAPIARQLRHKGLDVMVVGSILQAEEELKRGDAKPDLVIVDNLVPDDRSFAAQTDDVGARFVREMSDRRLFNGKVLLLSFFLPPDEVSSSIGNGLQWLGFADKNSLSLTAIVDRIVTIVHSTPEVRGTQESSSAGEGQV